MATSINWGVPEVEVSSKGVSGSFWVDRRQVQSCYDHVRPLVSTLPYT